MPEATKTTENTEITEIFILKMKEGDHVNAGREKARKDFVSLAGVTSWETLLTQDRTRPTLYAEIYKFPDHEIAKTVTGQFSKRPATKAFLNEVDEILVSQFFVPHTS